MGEDAEGLEISVEIQSKKEYSKVRKYGPVKL
jgi:hypothetical protein